MEQLRDIKDIIEIPMNDLWIYGGLVIFILALVVGYLLYRMKRRQKRKSPKEMALESLTCMDFTDAKSAAYVFTENGHIVAENNSLHVEALSSIVEALEVYKFKKDVPTLDDALVAKMQDFIKDVSHG